MKLLVKLSLLSLLTALAMTGCEISTTVSDLQPSDETLDARGGKTTCVAPNWHWCEEVDLIAGGGNPKSAHDVGEVRVWCDPATGYYYVQYYLDAPGCYITEVHVAAGECSDLPKSRPGAAVPGQFPYKQEGLWATEVCVCIGNPGDDFCVAAHAVVVAVDKGGKTSEETAWGEGDGNCFDKGWAMCFEVDCKKK